MKILLTGGLGYIGSNLAEKLSLENEVYVVDLGIYETKLKPDANIHIIKEDIRNIEWDPLFENGFDYVYHLAGISNDPGYGIDDEVGNAINYESSVKLFEKCKEYNIKRFIYPSSCSVYGHREEDEIVDETATPNPLTNYAKNKLLVENYITDNYGIMPYTILRPATVFGLSYRQRFDLVVNSFLLKMWYNEDICVSNRRNYRPSLFIDDLIKIYIEILQNKKTENKIYNVAANNMTLEEVFWRIKNNISTTSRLMDEECDASRSYRVSSQKIINDFDSKIIFTSIEDGIEGLKNSISKGCFDDYNTNTNYYGRLRQPIFFGR